MPAAIKAVRPPKIEIKANIEFKYSNRGAQRNIKNTPAVTMVAACSNELTGVGPSIASGNQI